jgi:cytochrome c-type protein NapB
MNMKKSLLWGFVLVLGSLPQLALSEPIESLRGDNAIKDMSEITVWNRVSSDFQTFELAYEQQPPLIRHFVEGYKITRQSNDCLNCHETNHFIDGNGNVLDKIDRRHYFCLHCHVPQVDADPLKENFFEPAND